MTKEELEQYVIDNYADIPTKVMARKCKVTTYTISHIAKVRGLKKTKFKLNEEQQKVIDEAIEFKRLNPNKRLNITHITKALGKSTTFAYAAIGEVKKKQAEVNSDYFSWEPYRGDYMYAKQ